MRIAMVALAAMVWGGAAMAQTALSGGPPIGSEPEAGVGYPSWDQARIGHYRRTLEKLRSEALKLQQADGGQLTPAHDAAIQARLDVASRLLAYNLGGRYDGSMLAHAPGRHP